jgi:hypothetical protein
MQHFFWCPSPGERLFLYPLPPGFPVVLHMIRQLPGKLFQLFLLLQYTRHIGVVNLFSFSLNLMDTTAALALLSGC